VRGIAQRPRTHSPRFAQLTDLATAHARIGALLSEIRAYLREVHRAEAEIERIEDDILIMRAAAEEPVAA
jgi:hypothetical protein